MKTFTITVLAIAAMAPWMPALSQSLECYEEPGTRKHMCIDSKRVQVNGETRSSPLYTGGPNGVRNSGFTFVVNCARRTLTLQDRDGVNFGGGMDSSTPQAKALADWTCAVPKPKANPRLRQF